jgi:hypothetical protein
LMLSTPFWQWASLWPLSSFPIIFFSIRGSKAYLGDLFSSRCMHDKCMNIIIYMMNSPFERWHMVITLAWWNKNFLFLIKLYNRNFLSDDHYIPRKSWIQDASRRACSDAKQIFTEHTS